jgi:hypothetical protein
MFAEYLDWSGDDECPGSSLKASIESNLLPCWHRGLVIGYEDIGNVTLTEIELHPRHFQDMDNIRNIYIPAAEFPCTDSSI